MKFKSILCLLLCAVLLFTFSACSGASHDKKYIVVIFKSIGSDFWNNVESGVSSAATENNVTVKIQSPENEEDYIAQNYLINMAVEDGADAIVLSAIDYDKSAETVTKAARSGVKIVTIDSDVGSPLVDMFIGTDNVAAGKMTGQAAVNGFSDGEKIYIGLVNYNQGTDNGQRREEGFRQFVSTVKNAEITAAVNVDSNTESATVGAMEMLGENPKINVIVGFNEWTTLGVGNAIKQLGLSEKVRGIGFDTNVVSIGMLETGEMDALIVQNPFAIGYLGVQNAAALADGKKTESVMYTETTIITKENLFDEDSQKVLFHFQ
ncbi:MAG: substrate-binding domain-containing protein [Clostridia bacterium]|nr:substrate-binding domain-containing protein [Clostridia bacterium]